MNHFWQDFRFTARLLIRQRFYSLLVILTLALGIGANTAVFSVLQGVVLKSLPYPESERLVRLYSAREGSGSEFGSSVPDLVAWKEAPSLELLEGYRYGRWELNHDPDLGVMAIRCSPGFLDLIGARPVLGRLFSEEDMQPGSTPVLLLSYEFWFGPFGGSPDVIGRTFSLAGRQVTVIGVLEPITGPVFARFQAITPWITENDPGTNSRGSRSTAALGRLKLGATPAQAQAELELISERLSLQFPETNQNWRPNLISLYDETVGAIRPILFALYGATLLILLIAVANVANLMLVRGNNRRTELAVRSTLGAGYGDLARLLLAESLLLSVLGGLLGIGLGWALLEILLSQSPSWIPRLEEVGLDWTVLGVSLAMSLSCGLFFGLAPVLQLVRTSEAEGLRLAGRGIDYSRSWLRSGLVVTQLALSLVLLTGSGLMIRSFQALLSVPIGVELDHIVTFSIGEFGFGGGGPVRVNRITGYRRVLENLRSLPGVTEATLTSQPPLGEGWGSLGMEIRGGSRNGEKLSVDMLAVEDNFFRFFRTRVIEGRSFQLSDAGQAESVAIIDSLLARALWPGESAVGRKLFDNNGQNTLEIIGVIEPIRYGDVAGEPRPKLFHLLDHPGGAFGGTFLIRHQGDADALLAAIPERVQEIDPAARPSTPQPLYAVYDRWLRQPRFYLQLLGALGGLALLVTAIGVFAVISYSVSQRINEIGIRMALGALASDILILLARQTLLWLGCGLAIGLLGALTLSRFLESLLFQVTPGDPIALASMTILLGATALIATLIAARRALLVDPAEAVRSE